MTEIIDESGQIVPRDAMPLAERGPVDAGALLRMAIEKGYAPEAITAFVDLVNRQEDRAAKAGFTRALIAFRAEAPIVYKGSLVDFVSKRTGERTHYKFASIDEIEDAIADPLNRHGLTYTFAEAAEAGPGKIRIVCRVRHVAGYSEDTPITLPMPSDMRANETQKAIAGISYGQRKCLCMALGLRIKGEDDDGQSLHATGEVVELSVTPIDFEESVQIDDLLQAANATASDRATFLDWASKHCGRTIAKIGEIPKSFYSQAIDALEKKQKGRK